MVLRVILSSLESEPYTMSHFHNNAPVSRNPGDTTIERKKNLKGFLRISRKHRDESAKKIYLLMLDYTWIEYIT